jgi:hypothetical protein
LRTSGLVRASNTLSVIVFQEHSTEVDALYNKIIELESRIEGQEQYSRRTSLRFHNIKVPVDERGNVKHPVNTDR